MPRKITTTVPDKVFEDFALVSSLEEGAPSPGQYARTLIERAAVTGAALRQELNAKKTQTPPAGKVKALRRSA